MATPAEHIKLFQSLFKGREDIYARRWENEDRDGYMPAYNVDWDRYEKHKALGGTFQDFKHKEPAPPLRLSSESTCWGKKRSVFIPY